VRTTALLKAVRQAAQTRHPTLSAALVVRTRSRRYFQAQAQVRAQLLVRTPAQHSNRPQIPSQASSAVDLKAHREDKAKQTPSRLPPDK
jgi:hypothetical protein